MRKHRVIHREGLYQHTRIRNGLRVVTEKIPSVRSISIGVWVDVGSRDELSDENGLTHFVEHMVFKGTRRRNARQIAAELESIGGNLNAFTAREQTCFTARVLDEHIDIALDVLADMVCNSTLTPSNLSREAKVIGEEIQEAYDNPSDRVFDEFAATFWGGHPLGQPILGTHETIANMPRKRIVKYIDRHYRTGSVLVAATGSLSHQRLVRLVREKFDFCAGHSPRGRAAQRDNWQPMRVIGNDSPQTHLCIGFPGLEYGSDDKMAALALNAYLGSGMSSVLFQKIREQRGLAYSVYSYLDFYRDTGLFGFYVGTNQDQVASALEIILTELNRVMKRRLATGQFDKVISQLKGQLMISSESTPNRMHRLARQELMLGRYLSMEETLHQINAVTPSDLLRVANQLFDRRQMTATALGPVDEKSLDNVVGR